MAKTSAPRRYKRWWVRHFDREYLPGHAWDHGRHRMSGEDHPVSCVYSQRFTKGNTIPILHGGNANGDDVI